MKELTQICPISCLPMQQVFQKKVLNKYTVAYYFCEESGLLKTEKPYWLEEAYSSAIAVSDTGLIQRNICNSHFLEFILELLFQGEGKFLDISGGYGILARLMRDKGFDFYTTDKYCTNLFASYFEPDDDFKAQALCAFEVLEHIENPIIFLEEIFQKYNCKTLIFSTLTFDNDQIPSDDWWYYCPETGQHVNFYQPRTLRMLADNLGLYYYLVNPSLHIITDIKLSFINELIIFNARAKSIYTKFVRRKRRGMSKTWEDHLKITNNLKNN
jgi:2-polyprenyl-3-methyl-5-hydroxy-6-metoxy-1,4-benzoquinol methylase